MKKKAAGGSAGSKAPDMGGKLVSQHKREATGHKVNTLPMKKGGACK